jgi:hypothetical protein
MLNSVLRSHGMWMMLRIFANDLGVTRYEMLVDNCGPLDYEFCGCRIRPISDWCRFDLKDNRAPGFKMTISWLKSLKRKCQLTTAEHQKKSALNRQRCLNDVANVLHPLSCEIVFTKIILGKERNILHMSWVEAISQLKDVKHCKTLDTSFLKHRTCLDRPYAASLRVF